MTIDQRRSRSGADLVPGLLAALAEVTTVLPFERTVGDEVQGLLDDAQQVVAALRIVLRDARWSVGVGIGAVEQPLPASVREARGDAPVAAREAVEQAKSLRPVRVGVQAPRAARVASDAQAVVGLIGTIVGARTKAQWRVIDAVAAAPSQRAAADDLSISPQAVSKALAAAAVGVEVAGYPLLQRLLEEADAA